MTALAADPWDPPPLSLPGLAASVGRGLTRAWWWVSDLPGRLRPVPHDEDDRVDVADQVPEPEPRPRHALPLDLERELPIVRQLVADGLLDPSVLAALRGGDWS